MSCSEPRGGMAQGRGALAVPAAILSLLLIVGGEATAQLPGQELEGKPVTVIEFVGLRKLQPGAVKAIMITKEGEPFLRESFDQDIKTLVARDLFAVIPSARAELDASGQGVKVTIVGDENARVQDVVFLGIIEFDRAELLPQIRTRRGGLVDDFTLQLDRKELIRFYRSKGYHYAEVGFTKATERFGDLILFKITEGPKVTIRRVVFNGNENFNEDELLKQMPFTDTPGFLSKKEFVLEQLGRDVVQLGHFYFAKGFLDARVTVDDWQPSADHEKVDITIDIVEGEPYRVRSITVEGSTLFEAAELMALMRTAIGGIYEKGFDLDRDRRDIRDLYLDRGYTAVSIRDTSTVDLESNEVDVVLEIVEGELVRVGEIIIRGNIETRDRIIRREIELYTGEPLNLRKLQRAQSRIQSLQYWQVEDLDRGVDVQTPEIPFQEYQIFRDTYTELQETKRSNIEDISVTVSEQDTGNLRFAAGIGSNSGLIGDITYQKNNFDPFDWPEGFDDILDAFTGSGQFLTLSFQPGTRTSRWRLAWGNPRLFDGPFGLNGELYRTFWSREDWDEKRRGYAFQLNRRFGDRIGLSLGIRDEQVEVDDINSSAPQLVFDFQGKNEVASLRLEGRLNMVDDYRDPTEGYLVIAWWEHAGLWGDLEFNKAEISGEHYTRIYRDEAERVHVIRIKGRAAWASEYGDSPDMPVYERFFLGGSGSLRGFSYRGVGPRDNGDPIGGKALWTLGVEYAFPIVGDQLRGVAFVDSGSCALDWSDSDIWNVRMGIGAGLRIVIPFLGTRPVAIDFGIPVLSESGDDTQIISFSFGSNF